MNFGKGGLWANVHAKRKRMKAGSGEKKAKKGDKDYPDTLNLSESSDTAMAMAGVDVMLGRLGEMKLALMQMQSMGAEVEIEAWMRDKLTLSADYISAVADNAIFGGGLEAEYAEDIYEKGLTSKEKKSAKKTAARRVKSTDKPAKEAFKPFPSDKAFNKRNKGKDMPESKATKAYNDKFGDTSDNAERKPTKIMTATVKSKVVRMSI